MILFFDSISSHFFADNSGRQQQLKGHRGTDMAITPLDKSGVSLANGLYYFAINVNGQKWIDKVLVLR
jgi:hypothetical protein